MFIVRWGYCNENSHEVETFEGAVAVAEFVAKTAARTGYWVHPTVADTTREDETYDGLDADQREIVYAAVSRGNVARNKLTREIADLRARLGETTKKEKP